MTAHLLDGAQQRLQRAHHQHGAVELRVVGQFVAFDLLGRRWALRVLWELREERVGFRALQERCGGMSSSVLRDRLRELVDAGVVETGDDGRYGLTEQGGRLLVALEPLSAWAEDWGA